MHGGDVTAADDIIAQKRKDGLVFPHPDNEKLETFYALCLKQVLVHVSHHRASTRYQVCVNVGVKEKEEAETRMRASVRGQVESGEQAGWGVSHTATHFNFDRRQLRLWRG